MSRQVPTEKELLQDALHSLTISFKNASAHASIAKALAIQVGEKALVEDLDGLELEVKEILEGGGPGEVGLCNRLEFLKTENERAAKAETE